MGAPLSKTDLFLSLHQPGDPLLLPNPWDQGTAKLFAALGFQALATTSSGFAGTLGRRDGAVSRDEAITHARGIVEATDLPVSADLENGYGDSPGDVADTVEQAVSAGLAGCSIEDYTRNDASPIYDLVTAAERVAAAAQAAHGATPIVLTARAENHLRGRPDLDDTIARLRAFEEAGADVLYAPGLSTVADVRRVVASVHRPVNVLLLPGGPTVAELAAAGVARISIGGAFSYVAIGAVAEAAREFLHEGTTGFWDRAADGLAEVRSAFGG